jgi:SHS2 domain-containing protein
VELDHTADWAILVFGTDLPDLLTQAAAGLLCLANPTPSPDLPGLPKTLRLRAADRESLLVRWLEELHFILETESQVPSFIRVAVSADLTLSAELIVTPVEQAGRPIKAVTFHGLRVTGTPRGLEATVVFDI